MKFLKQFSVLTLAFAAGAASAATAQPFTAATGSVTIDTAVLAAKGFTAASVGPSTYNASTGTLTDPLQGVSLITNPGALSIDFADAGGIALSTSTFLGTVTITLNNFTFNLATNTLSGDLLSAFGNYYAQDLLVASNVSSSFGTQSGTNASASTTARSLGLLASAFTLAPDLVTKLGTNANSFTFVADTIKQIKVGTVVATTPAVPEPSTYALLGLGLVGISLVARRKHNA
jgi:hypothetical protein